MISSIDEVKIIVALSLLTFAVVLSIFVKKFVNTYLNLSNEGTTTEIDESGIPLLGDTYNVEQRLQQERKINFSNIKWSNILTIFLNGETIQLVDPDPTKLLSTFIRDDKGLKGTKLGINNMFPLKIINFTKINLNLRLRRRGMRRLYCCPLKVIPSRFFDCC